MIRYICDFCKCEIDPQHESSYVVQMEMYAAPAADEVRIDEDRDHLDDFAEVTGIMLPPGPYDTAAGFLMAGLGRLPEKGDAVVCDDRVLTVAAMEGRRIARIEVRAVAE